MVTARRVGAGHGVGAPRAVEVTIGSAIDAIGAIGTVLTDSRVLELLSEVADTVEETHRSRGTWARSGRDALKGVIFSCAVGGLA